MIMKTLFRNLTVTAFCFAVSVFNASADNAKPVAFNQLPAQAQQFVKTHFTDSKVIVSTLESDILEKSYDVALNNGAKLEFDGKGQWTEVVCPTGGVPASILPEQVKSYLKSSFPNAKVTKVERDNGRFEVNLENGTEVTFNKKFQVTDIDL
jgi:hypothetical protein